MVSADRIAFDPGQQHQMRRVLRLRAGDTVVVCDGSGDELITRLLLDGREVSGTLLERRPGRPRPRRAIWLYSSVLRGDRFTWLLQKGTELGVAGFVPVLYQHSQHADYEGKLPRYQTVVREAAEQSERTTLPHIEAPTPFSVAVRTCDPAREICVLLDERERVRPLREVVAGARSLVRLFIGPEGGLTDEERRLAAAQGMIAAGMGAAILRSETAGLAAAVLALATSGNLG